MSPDSWLATGHHLAWQGHRLFYRIEPGTGPTVLFLHGFPTSSWDFDPPWEVLGSSVHRITLDFLGFGRVLLPGQLNTRLYLSNRDCGNIQLSIVHRFQPGHNTTVWALPAEL